VVGLSGRGDKDVHTVASALEGNGIGPEEGSGR
jgi:tryptophan synthase beta subunit